MPNTLLKRAEEIMHLLEEKHGNKEATSQKVKKIPVLPNYQLNIFDGVTDDLRKVQEILENTDINTLTPVEALLRLNELKGIVKGSQ
jgi:DNA mismatch repair protein MutS